MFETFHITCQKIFLLKIDFILSMLSEYRSNFDGTQQFWDRL